jgi:hypothetical protein
MIKQIYRFLNPKFQNLFLDYPVNMQPRYGHGKPPHSLLYDIINANREQYTTILESTKKYVDAIQSIKKSGAEQDVKQPTWNNGFLPGLDIVMLYTILAEKQPKKYVEVGSGNSTKVAHKVKNDLGLAMEITSIDPMPRAEIDELSDQIVREPFENIDWDAFLRLEAGDVLFIDNSHRMLPNSDATVFFLEVMPQLKPGVIVHIHDIYIPYDYPQFMCDRAYSEQYGLMIYLLANPEKYIALCPNYFISEDKSLSEIIGDIWKHENLQGVEQHGGSFWLQIG